MKFLVLTASLKNKLTKISRVLIVIIVGLVFITSASFFIFGSLPSSGYASSSGGHIMAPQSITLKYSLNGPSCSTFALCPSSITKSYGFSSLFKSGTNGSGQTIVIVDACGDPAISSDLMTFDSQFGLANPTFNVINVEGTPKVCDSAWGGETALDVEWSHVVAPGAAIDLLVTTNAGAQAMYLAWDYALDHNLGNQISNSWGGAGCSIKSCNNTIGEGIGPCILTNGTQGVNVTNILRRAAKDNITVLAAAGDGGAWGLGTKSEEPIPADCQGVLAVGGTALSVTSAGSYIGETGWNDGGGGYATTPNEPVYQKQAKITDSFGTLARPDVAADASCSSPVWTVEQGGWSEVCGTSLATPLWAGFIADVNQVRASHHLFPAGLIDPFLYKVIYSNPKMYHNDFHDVTTGNNGWRAGVGWDAVTGLGSFVASNLTKTLGMSKNA
jgi:subtilase family serine protease